MYHPTYSYNLLAFGAPRQLNTIAPNICQTPHPDSTALPYIYPIHHESSLFIVLNLIMVAYLAVPGRHIMAMQQGGIPHAPDGSG
jgi:hypothetical protein